MDDAAAVQPEPQLAAVLQQIVQNQQQLEEKLDRIQETVSALEVRMPPRGSGGHGNTRDPFFSALLKRQYPMYW